MIKFVGRGDTTVADAYLADPAPLYRPHRSDAWRGEPAVHAVEWQPEGGQRFGKGRHPVGPAGGIVGAVRTAGWAGFDKVITFDMGGTSTDVAHYENSYERVFETVVAGVRMQAPMLLIRTVAAGDSLCQFDEARFRVGRERRRQPGPACYRRGDRWR